jgi:carboxypeptidase Q
MRRLILGLLSVSLLAASLLAAEEKVDLAMVNRIKAEAFQNSHVMESAFYLTDVYGPRLTGSPGLQAAGEWIVRTMKEWGLSNAQLEKWGPFGQGWVCTRFVAQMKEPQFSPLIGFARPWSQGTNGPVLGDPILATINGPEDFEKYKGKLKGKIVLLGEPRQLTPVSKSMTTRYSEEELEAQSTAPDPALSGGFGGGRGGQPTSLLMPRPSFPGGGPGRAGGANARQFRAQLNKFLVDEGVLVVLSSGSNADGGTVFAQAAGSQDPKDPIPPPSVALTPEHYNRIARLLEKKQPVTLEFDIQARFTEPGDSFNVSAELPGKKKDAGLVMVGAHLDSWTGGTGATDNAAGCAVAMEAMRILKTLNVELPRTVRMGLWTGEEQGLLGSRAYVKNHFADPADMKLKPEHEKLSGYFNLDNGTGKIRGVYLQGNDMMRPIFEAWLAPFKDLGATTVTIRNTGGTDHQSYDAVGLPGFQFIQDPVEYSTRTHHSNMDLFDRLQAGDLMEASAIMASMIYDTAVRPENLPRKPLPKPQPARGPGGAGN